MKKDWELTQSQSEDEKEGNKIAKTMFLFGILTLVGLFIFGSVSEDVDTQTVLAVASIIFITVSILWSIRRKLTAYFFSFLGLIAVYFVFGLVTQALGVCPFSYGVMTFTIIFAFMFWIGADGRLTWDDAGKGLLFLIICFVANYSGWLGRMNDIINALLTGNIPTLGV